MALIYLVVFGVGALGVYCLVRHFIPARFVWGRRLAFAFGCVIVMNVMGALLKPILVGMALQEAGISRR